jgi:exopolysaccharide biosynthesis polyprenyl glycosylphosphotransferase
MTDTSVRQPAPVVTAAPAEPDFAARHRRNLRDLAGEVALFAADLAAVCASLAVVTWLGGARLGASAAVLVVPAFLMLGKMAGLHDRDRHVLHKTTLDEGATLLSVAAIFTLLVDGIQELKYDGASRPLLLWPVLTANLMVARAAARFLLVRFSSPERLVVVGDREAAALVQRKVKEDPTINAVVVGRIASPAERVHDAGVLGTTGDLPRIFDEHRVDRIVVAPANHGGEDVVDVIRSVKAHGVKVSVLPRLLEAIGFRVEFDDVGGQLVLGVRGFGLSRSSRFLKRAFDLLLAGLAVVLLAPFLLLVALLIKASSSGPVLFRQTRIGRHGNEFEMLKFRTMVEGADARKHELLERNEAAPLFKIAGDPRATKVGRLLRGYSLDELPQLFNVLGGDMSLVGPRPLIPEEDRMFKGWQRRRYHVAPGITGPWQIQGSSRVPVADMLTLDYLYCANWSLWLDLKIMARTLPYMLARRSGEHVSTPR